MYELKLYYNTGFDPSNVPDSPALIQSQPTGQYEALPLLQNRYLTTVRISVDSFNAIKNVDYAQIGDVFYFVTGIVMENETTATLTLQEDIIGTTGINNINVVSGWTSRRNYTTSEDIVGTNLISEPWQPQNPPQMEFYPNILGISDNKTNLIISSVALSDSTAFADAQTFTDGTDNVTIPLLPYITTTNSLTRSIYYLPTLTSGTKIAYVPNTVTYLVEDVADGLKIVRSLGVESALRGSYSVPSDLIETHYDTIATPDAKRLYQIIGKTGTYTTTNNPYYANVENKKALVQYHFYTVINVAAGTTSEYPIEDIWTGGNSIQFKYFVDPLPTGTVYIRPATYKGDTTAQFVGATKGAVWQNNEILWNVPSGWSVTQANLNVQRQYNLTNYQTASNFGLTGYKYNVTNQALGQVGGVIQGAISNVGGALGREKTISDEAALIGGGGMLASGFFGVGQAYASNAYTPQQYQYNLTMSQNEFTQNLIQNARGANAQWLNVDFNFPYQASLQSYLNNDFDLLVTHLSDDDVERFDLFLHQFGYACSEKFKHSHLANKQAFNYIKTDSAVVKCGRGVPTNTAIAEILNNGVRIWHVMPNQTALEIGGNADA